MKNKTKKTEIINNAFLFEKELIHTNNDFKNGNNLIYKILK